MTNRKSPILQKFNKKDRICNICQQEKDLSEDHIPSQVCPSAKNIVISKLLSQMTGDRSFRSRISQNGITYKTLCNSCNSIVGKYDRALGELSLKIESFVESNLILPDSFDVECLPNTIIRSILGHLLAAKTKTDRVVIDDLIRPCILDSSLPIPDDIHIFYWIHPYEITSILRDFAMPAIRGRLETSGFFNLIKFYPVGFLIAHQLSCYERLSSLHQFNELSLSTKANIQINLRSIKSSTWPEECRGLENYILVGQAANDSVYAVSKPKKIKI